MITPRPERLRDTYEAECLCGATVQSHTREVVCPLCKRTLVFEWGRDAVVVVDGRLPEKGKP